MHIWEYTSGFGIAHFMLPSYCTCEASIRNQKQISVPVIIFFLSPFLVNFGGFAIAIMKEGVDQSRFLDQPVTEMGEIMPQFKLNVKTWFNYTKCDYSAVLTSTTPFYIY